MKCTIIGAGRSGIAAAILAQKLGFKVFLSDHASYDRLSNQLETINRHGIEYECGGHSDTALEADLMIISPGVPFTAPIIAQAQARNIPIIGEVEFASRFAPAPYIAITGTNGKTTTTSLITHILCHAGWNAVACGNIGVALSDVISTDIEHGPPPQRIYVVEASSYQLALTESFHPHIAIILNITEDHLTYHGSMERYIEAKYRIFLNQTGNDILILCADDPHAARASSCARSRLLLFSLQPVSEGCYYNARDEYITFCSSTTEVQLVRYHELPLRGPHNVYNSMAAALAARALEVTNENIRDSLLTFSGVEHRLEHVRWLNGAEYINDSKATNINATWYALQAFSQPIILLLGGQADSNDYRILDRLVTERCKCIICFGEEGPSIFNHFCTRTRCYRVDTLLEAVHLAHNLAKAGDVVLFSPACKSFDQFNNFEHRGTVFKQLVHQLPE